MDLRRMMVTLAFVGIIYALGLHIPLPGIDLNVFAGQGYGTDSNAFSRISILALGLTPLYTAMGLAEIARLIAFPWLKRGGERDRKTVLGAATVAVIALAVAAVQAYAIAGALGAMGLVHQDMSSFTTLTIASFLGATAFTIFLSDRIRIAGLRNGFWPLYAVPILLSLPRGVIASAEMTRVGAVPSTQWLVVAVYLVLSVAAVVMTAFLWKSACRETGTAAEAKVEPREILIWPPVLAIMVAGYVLTLIALFVPNLVASMQGLPLQIVALAIASILIPLLVFAYVRQLEVKNGPDSRLAATASIIALVQILLLVSGTLVNAFIQLPINPGAIGVIVLTVTALGLRDWGAVEAEGSSGPDVSAQPIS